MAYKSTEVVGALKTNEAAAFLGLKPGTLKNWRSTGEGPAYFKIGWKVFYPKKYLKQFRERRIVLVVPSEKGAA